MRTAQYLDEKINSNSEHYCNLLYHRFDQLLFLRKYSASTSYTYSQTQNSNQTVIRSMELLHAILYFKHRINSHCISLSDMCLLC